MIRSNAALARGALLLWLIAAVPACGKDQGSVPFAPMGRVDAGAQGDAATASDGGKLLPLLPGVASEEQLQKLQAWGADIEDPDKICAGWFHSCAIDKSGKVWCWGSGARAMPPSNMAKAVQVVCGNAHSCALDENGKITCWGSGTDPNMGLGQSAVPKGVYKEVAAGPGSVHTCAIDDSDHVVCWGAGASDKRSDSSAYHAQAIAPSGKYKSISAGEAHSCAIDLATEEAVCWGGTGDGTCFPPRSYECGQTSTPLGGFSSVSAGAYHSCGVRLDGSVTCWGRGTNAQNCAPEAGGDGWDCGQSMPPPKDVDEVFVRVRSGSMHTCGVTKKHKAYCWGWNDAGQTVVQDASYAQVAAGDQHSCAIQTDGAITCWGFDSDGQATVPEGFPKP